MLGTNSSGITVTFTNFYVNTVDNGSGIFSGTNYANHWSSFSKSNNGFGTLSDGVSLNNYSVVYDNDFIDSPIDDRDTVFSPIIPGNNSNHVDFQTINLHALTNNSSISIGENNLTAWSGHSKRNSGNGTVSGRNLLGNFINQLSDNDYIDSPINDQDYKPGYMTQMY